MNEFIGAIGILVVILVAGNSAQVVGQQNNGSERTVKVTDSKLSPINKGLDSLAYWVGKMKVGDNRRANTLKNDLAKLKIRFDRLPASKGEQYKFVADRFSRVGSSINDKSGAAENTQPHSTSQMKNSAATSTKQQNDALPHRNLGPVRTNLVSLEKAFQKIVNDSNASLFDLRQARKGFADLSKSFQRIPKSVHPDYVDTEKRLSSLGKLVQEHMPNMNLSNEEASQILTAMREKYYNKNRVPQSRALMRNGVLSTEDVSTFVEGLKVYQTDLKVDLPKVKAAAMLDKSGISMYDYLNKGVLEKIESETETLKTRLNGLVEMGMRDAKNTAALDVKKNKSTFTNEAARKAAEGRIEKVITTLENAELLEKALGLPAEWSPKVEQARSYLATFRQKAGQAAKHNRLPVDVNDPALTKIAKRVLKIEKYGVGDVERMIVNSKKVPRDRTNTRVFNGQLETTVRKWDEFQVCTVEKEDEKYFVYFNTLKKFSRGPATTPIDQWILSVRFKSGEIDRTLLK